jgi:gamma-glutamylcyclotransferase (GGCT)/AIG2-like uncharacterized protein YtfP
MIWEGTSSMLYFAYGSNMSMKRLTAPERVPSARRVCTARLPKHQLRFHKRSNDGSAKCDAFYTGDDKDFVMGVLYEVSNFEKKNLDRVEGLNHGYKEKDITLIKDLGGEQEAITYYATDIDPHLKPYNWYKHHVLTGAQENNLPTEYISIIEKFDAVEDPDIERDSCERSIYNRKK